ncbi:MAG: arylesterase [Alphaproteobacteria bacterium]|nr:arylesterase [Alphaproteobacteria bacterium]
MKTQTTQVSGVPREYRSIYRVFNRLAAGVVFTLALAGAATASAAAAQTVIAVLGDSLAAGFGLPAAQAFPARLEAALRAGGADVRVINAGVSGDTSAGGLARVDWLLGDEPDIVIVELGSNDSLRGLDPAATFDNLDAIVARLKERKVSVMIAGMLAPRNLGREYVDEFDAIYPRLAEKHDVMLYPFFLDGVALDPTLNQNDLIHPNQDGVDVIVQRLLPAARDLIDRHQRMSN